MSFIIKMIDTIDIDEKQYFVTAKHVIENLKDDDEIEIFYQNKWVKIKAKLTGHSVNADVSVFASDLHIGGHPLSATYVKVRCPLRQIKMCLSE